MRRKLTPPQLAKLWGIGVDKVIAWIKVGELRAIDASKAKAQRPRYLIDLADIAEFEARRSVQPPPPPASRRKRLASNSITEFFSLIFLLLSFGIFALGSFVGCDEQGGGLKAATADDDPPSVRTDSQRAKLKAAGLLD